MTKITKELSKKWGSVAVLIAAALVAFLPFSGKGGAIFNIAHADIPTDSGGGGDEDHCQSCGACDASGGPGTGADAGGGGGAAGDK